MKQGKNEKTFDNEKENGYFQPIENETVPRAG